MSIKLIDKFVKEFVSENEIKNMQSAADAAFNLLQAKNGPGSDFLGWVDLPVNYDKNEFERIKITDVVDKIKENLGETNEFDN